jgi:hypothetical protein
MSISSGKSSCGTPSLPESVGLNICCILSPYWLSPNRGLKMATSIFVVLFPAQTSSTAAFDPSA